MNDEQKRYTVKKIDQYSQEAEKLDKKAEKNFWFIYGACALMIGCSKLRGYSDIPLELNFILGIIQYFGMALGIDRLKNMIGNMSKKSGLENMAFDLEYQLHMDELADKEEDNDKGRGL